MNKTFFCFLAIVLMFVVLFLLVMELPSNYVAASGITDTASFMFLFRNNAYIVLGVALTCMLVWFVLGEWLIHPFATAARWYLIWAVLLLVVLGTALYMCWIGPADNGVYGWYVGLGIVPFYLASVLFSPTNTTYRIPPAKQVRVLW